MEKKRREGKTKKGRKIREGNGKEGNVREQKGREGKRREGNGKEVKGNRTKGEGREEMERELKTERELNSLAINRVKKLQLFSLFLFLDFSIFEKSNNPNVAPNALVLTQHRFVLNSGKMNCF